MTSHLSGLPGSEAGRRALRRYRRLKARRALPVALLFLSLAIAGVGAFQAHRAQKSHHATAEALLRDYGAFAAHSFAGRWDEIVYGHLRKTLGPVRQSFLSAGSPEQCLGEILSYPRVGEPDAPSYASMAGAWGFHSRLSPRPADVRFQGSPPPPEVAAAFLEDVAIHARLEYRTEWTFAMVHARDEASGQQAVVAYVRLDGPAGDTVVYGVEVDRGALEEISRLAFEKPDLLPWALTHGKPNDELVAVGIRAPDGDIVYRSADEPAGGPLVKQSLPGPLGGGVVEASVLPDAAERLIIGGLPGDRMPVLLLIFGLAGGLALLAVAQLRKEEEFARQRSDFVASVSHELRTPLAQIRLFVETLLLGRARNDEQRDWALRSIDRETLRLTQLVENVLHFSRSERGLAPLELERVDLAAECREVVSGFLPLVRPDRVRLRCEVPEGVPVAVHRNAFRQVLLNLLDNAVKYGTDGQTVTVGATRDEGRVVLTVDDEGPGVPSGERHAVWEPFHRGEDARGSVAVGSGIGLSVVREIVRVHGGRTRVTDAPGGGARFVVELPDPAAEGLSPGEGTAPRARDAAGERSARPRRAAAPAPAAASAESP